MRTDESEREYAYRIAEEHRVLAEHYLTRNARRWRDHSSKSAAWMEYAVLLPTLMAVGQS